MINIITFSMLVFSILLLAWRMGYNSGMNRVDRHIEELEAMLDADEYRDLRKHAEDW